MDVKVVKPADEVSGKIGEPDQLSDQISVLSEMAKEANGSGNCEFSLAVFKWAKLIRQ